MANKKDQSQELLLLKMNVLAIQRDMNRNLNQMVQIINQLLPAEKSRRKIVDWKKEFNRHGL